MRYSVIWHPPKKKPGLPAGFGGYGSGFQGHFTMRHIIDQLDARGEQVELFPYAGHLPRRIQCREDKGAAPVIRRCNPKSLRRYPYIKVNPPSLVMWLGFDIDRAGALMAWEEAGLPPPACGAADPMTTRGHLLYPLTAPVLTGDAARDRPLRYLAAIEQGFRVRLGADPQFSASSHSSKNPWFKGVKEMPAWRSYWGPDKTWELAEMAEWVDLPKHMPKRGLKVENIGYGRNCSLFERLRQWAYHAVRRLWAAGGGAQEWAQWVQDKAAEMNGDFGEVGGDWCSLSGPMSELEVYHVAKHVAKYVWSKFSPQAFSEIQQARKAGAEYVKKRKELEQWLQSTK